jgi:hypothetical protein
MRRMIVKAHSDLSATNRIRERPTPGYQHNVAGTGCQRVEPVCQLGGEGVASAELDNRRTSPTSHSLGSFRVSGRGRIKLMHIRCFGRPFACDFDTHTTGAHVELLCTNRHAHDPSMGEQ